MLSKVIYPQVDLGIFIMGGFSHGGGGGGGGGGTDNVAAEQGGAREVCAPSCAYRVNNFFAL